MQFAEDVQANWQEGYCFIMVMPDPIQPEFQELQWEHLEHPPHRPTLAPSDFHLFGPLKRHLGGRRVTDDEEFERDVRKWLR
jgi:hypothetical protein